MPELKRSKVPKSEDHGQMIELEVMNQERRQNMFNVPTRTLTKYVDQCQGGLSSNFFIFFPRELSSELVLQKCWKQKRTMFAPGAADTS